MTTRAVCLGVIGLLATCVAAAAQNDPCKSTGPAPGDVQLRLTLADGRTVYQDGEIVPLALEFTAAAPGKYFVDTRNYDRSGRLMTDAMCLEPGTDDPLADYFDSGLSGFIGGGIGSELELNTYHVSHDLNEWKSLPPGTYRVRVVSRRVSRKGPPRDREHGVDLLPLTSNTVEFKVRAADEAWQAAELVRARNQLDDPGASAATRKAAARILRFLGSEAAARELVRRYYSLLHQPTGWDLMFGLVASPFRRQVIQDMRAAIEDPVHPITRDFLQTLALLEIQSEVDYRLPAYGGKNEPPPAWRTLQETKRAKYDELFDRHVDELAEAVDAKSGLARAFSVDTVLTSPGRRSGGVRWRKLLIESWDLLPPRTRNELIEFRWDDIRGAEMLPILRDIVDAPANVGRGMDGVERGPALRRIYELSPDEGRGRIRREMLEGKGDIGIDVLGMLPDAQLPEIEQPLLAKLRQGRARDIDYQLLARYGSRTAFAALQALYEQHAGGWACEPQNAMLRYFVRVDPDYGPAAVADAMTYRETTGCYKMTLSGIGDAVRNPAVQTIALAALNDPSYAVVADAAGALAKYGSPGSEAALWERLKRFHESRTNKAAQLVNLPGIALEDAAAARAEYALLQAIATGQEWLCGPEKLESLKALVSLQQQREVDRMRAQWNGPLQVSLTWWPQGTFTYMLGYMTGDSLPALKRKLMQLAPGTHLVCVIAEKEYDARAVEIAQVESTASAAGLVLEIRRTR
jgi:hypothetical protein